MKSESDLKVGAQKLIERGTKAVLIKGGHLNVPEVIDFLFLNNGKQKVFRKTRVPGQTRHGTGCVLSAAITANLANKMDLLEAVDRAEKYIDLIFPEVLKVGRGNPPINPFSKSF